MLTKLRCISRVVSAHAPLCVESQQDKIGPRWVLLSLAPSLTAWVPSVQEGLHPNPVFKVGIDRGQPHSFVSVTVLHQSVETTSTQPLFNRPCLGLLHWLQAQRGGLQGVLGCPATMDLDKDPDFQAIRWFGASLSLSTSSSVESIAHSGHQSFCCFSPTQISPAS